MNNLDSILSGIFKGLSNSKTSGGISKPLAGNPLEASWIGLETNDLRAQIQKEGSQNPALDWHASSSGTQVSYTKPVPTDILTRISSSYPQTDIGLSSVASSVGSLVQAIPKQVQINNLQFNGYEMNPTNGGHFFTYFANQLGNRHLIPVVNPASVLTAIGDQQNIVTDGNANTWDAHLQFMINRNKGYMPATSFFGGKSYPSDIEHG